MTVKSESQGGVINLTPLKKSASFTISVDQVEVQPSKIYSRPLAELSEVGEEEWSSQGRNSLRGLYQIASIPNHDCIANTSHTFASIQVRLFISIC